MKATINIVYGIFSYAIFLASLLYAFGFMANFWVPWPIDAVPRATPGRALLINVCLVAVLATHHCLLKKPLARHAFLRRMPLHLEHKSCFLVSGASMILVFWLWQPVGRLAWDVDTQALRFLLHAGFAAGCITVLTNAVIIGKRARHEMIAAWSGFWGAATRRWRRGVPALLTNPLYAGWLLVFWCVPTMTVSHLALSVVASVFVLLALAQERQIYCSHSNSL